jgi:flagellar hook-associated protein 3 FlgL
MSGIIPIPTTRVGDYFIRQRLTNQVESDQLELFNLQNQVSTGKRLLLPSDDAPAALRAIDLQRALERKQQYQISLQGSQSLLDGADSSLQDVSTTLNNIKAEAIGVNNTTSTDDERKAVISDINEAIKNLVKFGNSNLKGQYLFAGSTANTQPFDFQDDFVTYSGNEKSLRNFVDSGFLFNTNAPGSDVFGGLSSAVRGSVDLNPQLTSDTSLGTINGGQGISPNAAISVTVKSGSASTTSIVDLSSAATIGDVARLIEAHPPAGSTLTVDIVNNGLSITSNSGTTVKIGEVATATTAHELGIFTPTSASPVQTVQGGDLNPAVLKTTLLANLLGTKAQGRVASGGQNNDLVLTAAQTGTALNGVSVQYVSGATAGNESASYDANTSTLTVQIQSGVSTANQVATAINNDLAGTFSAQADTRDATSASLAGTNAVSTATFNSVTANGSGQPLDTTHGLILTNGGKSVNLDISQAKTVEDLTNLINGAGLQFQAQINAAQNGIDVRSRLSGADFTIGENGGTTATQLGIRTYAGSTNLADLNRGIGVPASADPLQSAPLESDKLDQLQITARDGNTITVDLSNTKTLQDVIGRVNSATGNNTGTTAVRAQINASGQGIELVDASTSTTGPLTVTVPSGTHAAEYLGLVPTGGTQATSVTTDGSGNYVLGGKDLAKGDLNIIARDGKKLVVDLTGATTVQDVINIINQTSTNAGASVTAQLATNGNGIELVDSSSTTTGDLTVQTIEGSTAAQYLGFVPKDQTQVASHATDGSGNYVLTSEDRNTQEVDGIFNSLIRLKTALESGDVTQIGAALTPLDSDLSRLSFARAEIGSRTQSLGVIATRLQDENTQLQSSLSDETDVDLVQAISNLTAKQYALQASLQTTANILNLSILNYL